MTTLLESALAGWLAYQILDLIRLRHTLNERALLAMRERAKMERFRRDLLGPIMEKRRVEEHWVFPTPTGNQLGFRVRGSCDAEIAGIVCQYLHLEKVA